MLWSVWLSGRKKIVLAKQIRALTGPIPEGRFIDLFFYLLRALLLNAASESLDVLPASRRIRSNNAKDGCS